MARGPPILFLSLVLAGCASTGDPAADPAPVAALTTLVAALDTGIAEASLAIMPDDNVTIVAVSGPVHAWRGPASGTGPWAEVAAPGGPGDTDLAQSDGLLHHVGLFDEGGNIPYQRSRDGGRTWSDVVDLSPDVGGVDRPWIAAAGNRVAAAWGTTYMASGLYASLSDDAGETWSAPSKYSDRAAAIGDIAIDARDGTLFTSWASYPATLHVSSTHDGRTWEDHVVASSSSYSFPALAVDAAGAIYVVWSAPLEGRVDIPRAQGNVSGFLFPAVPTHAYLSASTDGGATWSAPLDLTAEGTAAWYPTVAAGAAGSVVVAWYEMPLGPADGNGKLVLALSEDAAAATPRFERREATPEPVPLGMFCDTTTCDSARNIGEVLEVTLRPNGAPAVAWIQAGESGVEIHYASPSGDV